jgi:hypothetical protein
MDRVEIEIRGPAKLSVPVAEELILSVKGLVADIRYVCVPKTIIGNALQTPAVWDGKESLCPVLPQLHLLGRAGLALGLKGLFGKQLRCKTPSQ